MKKLFAIIVALLSLSMQLWAQESVLDRKVTLHMRNARLEEVIESIMIQTGVMFIYRSDSSDNDRTVDVEVKEVPLRKVLADIGVEARVEGQSIILRQKEQAAGANPSGAGRLA